MGTWTSDHKSNIRRPLQASSVLDAGLQDSNPAISSDNNSMTLIDIMRNSQGKDLMPPRKNTLLYFIRVITQRTLLVGSLEPTSLGS